LDISILARKVVDTSEMVLSTGTYLAAPHYLGGDDAPGDAVVRSRLLR
jgi:hypothetical protein